MHTKRDYRWGILLCIVPFLLASCRTLWGNKSPDAQSASSRDHETTAMGTATDYEAQLRSIVRKEIENANDRDSEGRQQVVWRDPYYFKEYVVYPDGPDAIEVLIQEMESRTTPYVAEVKLRMLRFATRYHRHRDEARNDSDFVRDTGAETMTYELRNGRWVRTGRLVVSDTTEQIVDGKWVPVGDAFARTVVSEEPSAWGWPKRVWAKVTGQ